MCGLSRAGEPPLPQESQISRLTEASLRANAKEGFLFVINHEALSPQTVVSLDGLEFPVARIVDLENGNDVPQTRADGAVRLKVDTALGVTRLFHVLPAPQ